MVERPDADFVSAYLGGQPEDWYVRDQDGTVDGTANEAVLALSLAALSAGSEGFKAPQLYESVKTYLDITRFSDYMILNWYAGNKDWPYNNWYATARVLRGRLQFIEWDAENTFKNGAEIRLQGWTGGPPTLEAINTMTEAQFKEAFEGNPIAYIFIALMANPDFKMEFADRAYLHLFNNGALTDANAQARWQQINNSIDRAIVGESARWGDVRFDKPITRDDWLAARDNVLAQMEGNAQKLISLLREAGYYPPIDPPLFSQRGGAVEPGFALQLSLPPPHSGTIYYTLNGSDPRAAGSGAVSPAAVAYRGPITLTANTQVKTRLLAPDGATWSALNQATFTVAEPGKRLHITEIMYNPAGGNDYEFIELKNNGDTPVDVSNMRFEGIDFIFPPGAPPLLPGQFVVLVNSPAAFKERYPEVSIDGSYSRQLSNAGEKITLRDADGNVVTSVAYDDELGWPVSPDGRGDSLVLVNLSSDPNDAKNWRASATLHGSPGADDPAQAQADEPKKNDG